MEYRRCFFIGHREASEEILPALKQAVEQHVSEYGVTDFIVGSYGGFDRLVAAVLAKAKERHPRITLTLLLPYHPAERQIALPKNFDRSFYLSYILPATGRIRDLHPLEHAPAGRTRISP